MHLSPARVLLVLFLAVLSTQAEVVPETRASAIAEKKVSSFIPMEDEDRYQKLVAEAVSHFEEKEYAKAMEYLDQALLVYPRDPSSINLRGAILTKMERFEEARQEFEKSLAQDPQFFPARFNLGEILFLEGKNEEALSYFEALNDNYWRNELIEFKLVILFSVTGRLEDAQRLLGRMRYPGDTPAWYYANAAYQYAAENPNESRKYLRAARSIFDQSKSSLYEETLVEANLMDPK